MSLTNSQLVRFKMLIVAFLAVIAGYFFLSAELPLSTTKDGHPAIQVQADRQEDTGTPIRVLLLGNSYAAGMRQHLEQLFIDDPDRALHLTAILTGGRRLVDHLHDPRVLNAIEQEQWDVIVLQEQSQLPSAAWINYVQSESQLPAEQWFDERIEAEPFDRSDHHFVNVHLPFWLGSVGLAEKAKEAGIRRIVYVSTWPRHPYEFAEADPYLSLFVPLGAKDGPTASQMMLDANNKAAEAWQRKIGESATVSYVGTTFWEAFNEKPSVEAYSNDHSHASTAGYKIAAKALYHTLIGDWSP